MQVERVFLIGLSGTGKSSVAPLVAARLGFDVFDTDQDVATQFDRPVPQIFDEFGESVFRACEREAMARAARRTKLVVATGGGVVLDEANWAAMRPASVIVHLTTTADQILERLGASGTNGATRRPLLEGADPRSRLEVLWAQRRHLYERADYVVDTTSRSPEDVAEEVASVVRAADASGLVPVTSIATPSGRSDLYVAPGLLDRLGTLVRRRWPDARRCWLVSDEDVFSHWGEPAAQALRGADFAVESHTVPAGEASKSLAQVEALLDWLIEGRLDRRDIVVALGGGVVGDLAGFVAAIALRGVPLVQVPTSLLAMVDSSVGGKTGVNHPAGKNLIGAFYQPPLVVADPLVLGTLPRREVRAGWAEIVKHAMIERSATGAQFPLLLEKLEATGEIVSMADPAWLAEIVRHNIRLKAAVVRADEREAGLRRLLNYGHTLGHAFEAAGYRYLHGEAVALGMRAAARLSETLGRCDRELVHRQSELLDRIGLPKTFDGEWSLVAARMSRDKKAVHGSLTWVLPVGPGLVEICRDVPQAAVEQVAREIGAR